MCGHVVVKPTMSPSGPTPPGTSCRASGGRPALLCRDRRLAGRVGLEVADVRQAVCRIAEPREWRAGVCPLWNDGRGGRAGRGDARRRIGTSDGRYRLCDRTASCVPPIAPANNGESDRKSAPCRGRGNKSSVKSNGRPPELPTSPGRPDIPNTPRRKAVQTIRTSRERPCDLRSARALSRSHFRLDAIAAHLFPQRRARNFEPLRRFADLPAGFAEHALDLPLFRRVANRGERKDRIAFFDPRIRGVRERDRPASATGQSRGSPPVRRGCAVRARCRAMDETSAASSAIELIPRNEASACSANSAK